MEVLGLAGKRKGIDAALPLRTIAGWTKVTVRGLRKHLRQLGIDPSDPIDVRQLTVDLYHATREERFRMDPEHVDWRARRDRENALIAQLKRAKLEGRLVDSEMVLEFHAELSRRLRHCGEFLQKTYGPDAADVVNQTLDGMKEVIRNYERAVALSDEE